MSEWGSRGSNGQAHFLNRLALIWWEKCCSVLQLVAACCPSFERVSAYRRKGVVVCRRVLQCVAVCCSVLQCMLVFWTGCFSFSVIWHHVCSWRASSLEVVFYSVFQCVVACCSMLQHVAACCSMLHFVAHLLSQLFSKGRLIGFSVTVVRVAVAESHGWRYVAVCAQKAVWNPASVEPAHWNPADINSGSIK